MNCSYSLDRDGTINVGYIVHKPKESTWCDIAIESIKWMNIHNIKVIVVK